MSKDYGKILGELSTISCPVCKSEKHTFKRPVVNKGSIILPCTCSDCKLCFTVMYKAYEVQYNNGSSLVTVTMR